MSDPQILYAQARLCSGAAAEIDQKAPALADLLAALGRQHPVEKVWAGPAADVFTQVAGAARRDVDSAVAEALEYAQQLRRTATDLERQASQQELTQRSSPAR